MRQWIGSTSVQIMACSLYASSHYINQCWVIVNWTLRNKLQWNFDQKYEIFHSRKCIWKYRLQNGGHFVGGDPMMRLYPLNSKASQRHMMRLYPLNSQTSQRPMMRLYPLNSKTSQRPMMRLYPLNSKTSQRPMMRLYPLNSKTSQRPMMRLYPLNSKTSQRPMMRLYPLNSKTSQRPILRNLEARNINLELLMPSEILQACRKMYYRGFCRALCRAMLPFSE